MKELGKVAAKWHNLGLALDVDSSRLEILEADNGNVTDCLREMLKVWLRNADRPTWERVAKALESSPIDMEGLAQSIRAQYCGRKDARPEIPGY